MILHQAIMIFVFALCLLLVDLAHGNSLSRIIGGSDTTIADHPHQVSLEFLGSHSCGGSIVDSQWILTAAHCVDRFQLFYTISLNDGNLNTELESFSVASIVSHPGYNNDSFDGFSPNDIALVKLNSPITSSDHKPISLAKQDQLFDGANCTISGWGNTAEGGESNFPNQLQETHGKILTSEECNDAWGNSYNHDLHICIDNFDTGSCNGDSGGPMVCFVGNENILAGVTSWGASGCFTYNPSVYTRVSKFRDWIDQVIADE